MMDRYQMQRTLCPNCNHPLNGGTDMLDGTAGQRVKPGTLGLCAYCAEVIVYLEEGEMAVVTPEQLEYVKKQAPDMYEHMMLAQKLLKDDKT